jgi:hypothetical protein
VREPAGAQVDALQPRLLEAQAGHGELGRRDVGQPDATPFVAAVGGRDVEGRRLEVARHPWRLRCDGVA